MKIIIIGAGAMGMLFGGRLAQKGNDVTMVDVVPTVVDKLNKDGIIIDSEDGVNRIPIKASLAKDVNEKADLVLIFTKTIYTRSALEGARHIFDKETAVMTCQNGLGNIELISEFVPFENIIAGVTTFASDVKGLGEISSHGHGHTKIMTADGNQTEMLLKVDEALRNAGLNSEIVPDVMVAIWEKVAFNAAINACTAACRIPCGGMAVTEEGKNLVYAIAKETVAVANAHGVKASEQKVIDTLTNTFTAHKDHFTSMAQDILKKRQTEVAFINGGIVKKAKEVGLEVPYTETLFALIKTMENNYDIQG